jgi:hypothetical protein
MLQSTVRLRLPNVRMLLYESLWVKKIHINLSPIRNRYAAMGILMYEHDYPKILQYL